MLLALAGIRVEVFVFRIFWIFWFFQWFGEAGRLEFSDALNLPSSQALAFRLVAFDGNELFCIDFL